MAETEQTPDLLDELAATNTRCDAMFRELRRKQRRYFEEAERSLIGEAEWRWEHVERQSS